MLYTMATESSAAAAYASRSTPQACRTFKGTTLDVVDEGLSRRLRFDNPNARQTCGCGESLASRSTRTSGTGPNR